MAIDGGSNKPALAQTDWGTSVGGDLYAQSKRDFREKIRQCERRENGLLSAVNHLRCGFLLVIFRIAIPLIKLYLFCRIPVLVNFFVGF